MLRLITRIHLEAADENKFNRLFTVIEAAEKRDLSSTEMLAVNNKKAPVFKGLIYCIGFCRILKPE